MRDNSHTRFFLLHSIAPLALGTLIYLLWRSETLAVFGWLRAIHLSGPFLWMRHFLSNLRGHLPDWFLYSVPDGLWLYAATTSMGGLWLAAWRPEAWLWVMLPLILGCSAELGQFTGVFPGTYSALDIVAYGCGAIFGLMVLMKRGNQETV